MHVTRCKLLQGLKHVYRHLLKPLQNCGPSWGPCRILCIVLHTVLLDPPNHPREADPNDPAFDNQLSTEMVALDCMTSTGRAPSAMGSWVQRPKWYCLKRHEAQDVLSRNWESWLPPVAESNLLSELRRSASYLRVGGGPKQKVLKARDYINGASSTPSTLKLRMCSFYVEAQILGDMCRISVSGRFGGGALGISPVPWLDLLGSCLSIDSWTTIQGASGAQVFFIAHVVTCTFKPYFCRGDSARLWCPSSWP